MRPNPVKRKLAAGGTALGTMVFEFAVPAVTRLAASSGAEFALFDMEHTGLGFETIRGLVAAAQGTALTPLVRVPALEYHFVARALDGGAQGVMVPMIETEDQARQFVHWCKYPPRGGRGAAFGIAHDDYCPGDLAENMRSADDEGLLIALIETAAGVAQAERIAAVPGIDVLWVGHFDLTNSLGIPGAFEDPRFRAALETIAAAAARHGKALGILAGSVAEGQARLAQGFRCLAYGGDLWLYQQALRSGLAELRRSQQGRS